MNGKRDIWIRGAALGAMIALALAVRLYNANAPFMDPIAHRSDDSAVIAQSLYHLEDPSTPDWKRRVAETNMGTSFVMEPRILEHLTALGYRVTGVCCWLPRMLSSLFWCLSAVALYRLVAEMSGCGAAFASTAFFLFTPFAIFSSRQFQPDPLMTALTVLATYALWCEVHRPTWLTLIVGILATGAAMLVKIQCAMILGPTLVALVWGRHGFRGALSKSRVWVLAIGACLPALWYYGRCLLLDGTLQYQIGIQWKPILYCRAEYWLGWAHCMATTAGIPALALSGVGLFLPATRPARFLVTGLWTGYLLEGLVFSEAFDHAGYYHMPLLFIVAIGLGAPLARLIGRLWQTGPGIGYSLAAAAVGLMATAAWIGLGTAPAAKRILSPQIRGSIEATLNLCGANTVSIRRWGCRYDDYVETSVEIGRRVNHSNRVIILANSVFRFLEFHGLVAVHCWPDWQGTQELESGKPLGPIETTFERFCGEPNPEYLLAWPAAGLDAWPELKRFLEQRYPVLEHNDHYLLFDMRMPLSPEQNRPGS